MRGARQLIRAARRHAGPLQLQISNIGSDPFIGRLGIGRIKAGSLKKGVPVALSAGPGEPNKQVKVSELFNFDAMGRAAIDEGVAAEDSDTEDVEHPSPSCRLDDDALPVSGSTCEWPSIVLFHGTADQTVPWEQSRDFARALRRCRTSASRTFRHTASCMFCKRPRNSCGRRAASSWSSRAKGPAEA